MRHPKITYELVSSPRINELAVLEGADLVLSVEKFGGRGGGGADGFERCEAALGEPDELFGVFALTLGAS